LLPLGALAAYGTKVPDVRKGNLSFLAGVQVNPQRERPGNAEKLQFAASNGENIDCTESESLQHRREIVNRTFARTGALLATIALGLSLCIAGAALAQTKATKKAPAGKADPAAVARGKDVFQQKCSTCHYDTSDAKKIGPGLKGISKRGTFTVNNNKVTDETLKTWIENGDSLMPPFKDVIEDAQIKDVIAYVKTL
jgi:mono/diheme cytochrome c family protein